MKQMRSRFRLITLLLVCAFLLTLVLCAGSVLKTAGITLSSLSSLPFVSTTASPDPSVSSDIAPDTELTLAPSELPSDELSIPGTDNSPVPEYNVFGL